jgi:pyruvate,orthophosphate dikinase
MIPLICEVKELKYVKDTITKTADQVIKESGVELNYLVGTMIEIPRACLTADEIATEAEFFSFGTNDLTQMTYGLSRDDAGKILEDYYEAQIFESDPTARLDQVGVGRLMKMAVELGAKDQPDIKLGICGEHGGDPSSVPQNRNSVIELGPGLCFLFTLQSTHCQTGCCPSILFLHSFHHIQPRGVTL